MDENYYLILNVDTSASGEEIKKAYRALVLQYHPDLNKNTESEDRIKEINEAYAVLSDPEKKIHYDLHGTIPRGTYGPNNNFSGQQWQGMGFGRGRGRRCGCGGKGFGPWGVIFRNSSHSISMEGCDYICKISFSSEELEHGTRRSLFLRDVAGVKKVSIEVPPGSKKGARVITDESSGKSTGKIIIEIQ